MMNNTINLNMYGLQHHFAIINGFIVSRRQNISLLKQTFSFEDNPSKPIDKDGNWYIITTELEGWEFNSDEMRDIEKIKDKFIAIKKLPASIIQQVYDIIDEVHASMKQEDYENLTKFDFGDSDWMYDPQ